MEATIAQVVDSVGESFKDSSRFKSIKGIVFKLKRVNKLAVVDATKKIPLPKVPVTYIPEKNREEENPMHPDYIEAVEDAQFKRGMVSVAVYLSLGTTLDKLPNGVQSPTDTEWAEELTELGIDISEKPRSRYVDWIKYYALDDDELNELVKAVMRYSGATLEEDVKEAQDSFRDNS